MIAPVSPSSPQFLGPRIAHPDLPSHPVPSLTLRSPRARRFSAAYTAATERNPSVAAMAAVPASLYGVLGLQAGATCQEIKSAYRSLARACHPDVVATATDRKGGSADEFMRIHAAYSTLSDPDKRADYDRRMVIGRQRRSAGSPTAAQGVSTSPSFSGYSRRTWETDQCW